MLFFSAGVVCAQENQDKAFILMYSGIVRKPDGKNVTAKSFKKHIEILKKNGYQAIRLQDLLDFYYQNKPLPPKSVLITFDGSREDAYRHADKILKEARYNAVMFLLPDKINSGDHFFICWHDVKNMLKSKRWEFGASSEKGYKYITIGPEQKKGPYLFNRLWLESEKRYESDEELTERIRKEYAGLKEKVNKKIKELNPFSLSIPYGNYLSWSTAAKDNLAMSLNKRYAEENFKLVFLQGTDGMVTRNNNPQALGRLIVAGDWSELDFAYHLGLKVPRLVRFFDDFNKNRLKQEWTISSGLAYCKEDKLYMYPVKDKNDAFLYLRGTEGVDNCIIETQAQVELGSQFWLYAKYFDRRNYVRFGLSEGRFYLQRVVNGNMQEQVRGKDAEIKNEPHSYKLVLKQNAIVAVLDGSRFGKLSAVDKEKKGLIAVETWSKSGNLAGAQLSYFRVQSFMNQWACFTPKNADEANNYKEILALSSVFSPLCFERKGTKVSAVSDINLMRMICGQYGLSFVPRMHLAGFNKEELGALKSWVKFFLENYAVAGLNIELSDEISKDTRLVDSLIEELKDLLRKNKIGLVITMNIPAQLEDYYTKDIIAKCSYLIVKNKEPGARLNAVINDNAKLIKSVDYQEDLLSTEGEIKNETIALW